MADRYTQFFELARSYTHLDELDRDTLVTFVDRIEIGPKIYENGSHKIPQLTHRLVGVQLGDDLVDGGEPRLCPLLFQMLGLEVFLAAHPPGIFGGVAVCAKCGHALCSCGTVYKGEREKYWYPWRCRCRAW